MLGKTSLSPLGEFLHTSLSVAYVLLWQIPVRILLLPLAPISFVMRALRLDGVVGRFPRAFLIVSMVPATVVAAHGSAPPFGSGIGAMILGSLCWYFFLHLIEISYPHVARIPTDEGEYEKTILKRWPDRWYHGYMRNPKSAVYIRTLVLNSALRIPAVGAVVLPGDIGFHSVVFFIVIDMVLGAAHEVLDHADIHNNIFSSRHLERGPAKRILSATGRYLRFVLNPLFLRVPHFYRVQHVYVHHVENNGVRDTQTTAYRDRTSFFDYSKHALAYGLSWSFAIDVFLYLYRKGNRRQCLRLAAGFAIWFAGLAVLALFNWMAALFFLLYRFWGGPASAMESYFQHGFVDVSDPENIYRNTNNWIVDDEMTPAAGDFIHVRHHLKSGEHFGRQLRMSPAEAESWEGLGVIALGKGIDNLTLLRALLTRRFDVIAGFVVPFHGRDKQPGEVEALLERRTFPLIRHAHTTFYHAADRWFGRLFVKYLLPGGEFPRTS